MIEPASVRGIFSAMDRVQSRDGTLIAYERTGKGPALILVTGALADRADARPVAAALAAHFTAVVYDRRGRGDSGDTPPFAMEREIEDIDALIHAAGGQAFLFGHSSGAALAVEAAVRGLAISKLALYEPPYIVNDNRPPLPSDFVSTLESMVAAGPPGAAVEYFWRVGMLMPPQLIAQMKTMPMWPGILKVERTLPYDGLAMGGHMSGRPLPAEWASKVTMPTLVIDGGESPASLRDAVAAVAELLPRAERRTLDGQGHGAPPEVLAPLLTEFLLGKAATRTA
jgi:pimeloyl-ACP methyl ester carboxylesterase